MKVKLKDILTQSKSSEYIEHPENEKFVTVSGHGQGVKERKIGEGKVPVQFNGYRVKAGQLIYSRIGASDGAFGIVPNSLNNAVVSKDFPVFNVDSAKADINYLVHYLTSEIFCHIASKESFGATMTRFKEDKLLNCELELPVVAEQERIVDILNDVKSIISLRQQELQKLDELVKARFVELFGDPVRNDRFWSTLPLEEACKSIADCPHSTPSYTSENTGYMCIRTSIVKKNRILWDEIEYISEEEFEKRVQRKKPEVGDVVYTREGAILGIAAIIDRECNVALGQRSMLLSPDKSKCNSEFLCVAMNCESFLDNALKGVAGSASPHINVGDIKTFKMIMPPIELQNQFADFVKQVDKSKVAIQKSLIETQLLFDSLMQKYFG